MQMRNRLILIALALAFIAGILLWRGRGFRLRPPPAMVSAIAVAHPPMVAILPPGPVAVSHVPVNLRGAIDAGTKALEALSFDPSTCYADPVPVKVRQGEKIKWVWQAVTGLKRCRRDYLLAVTDETGKLNLVRVPEKGSSFPPGYRVTVEKGGKKGGVNVPFRVTTPPKHIVVGLKTTVLTQDGGVEEGVYVPYSSALDVQELRDDGLRYLERMAAEALADLRGRRVKSQFYRGQLVADMVELQHMVSLVLTEQMKSDVLFERGTETDRVAMVNRTLTILGANLKDAYSYTRSRVGAAGIAQLMRSTYHLLRKAYPTAGLPADQIARLDHHEALKAMILHADAEWYPLANDAAYRDWLRGTHDARRLMLAAGYNASAGTVVKAIKGCRETWRDTSCRLLPTETRRYLIKYEAVWTMLYPVIQMNQKIASTL